MRDSFFIHFHSFPEQITDIYSASCVCILTPHCDVAQIFISLFSIPQTSSSSSSFSWENKTKCEISFCYALSWGFCWLPSIVVRCELELTLPSDVRYKDEIWTFSGKRRARHVRMGFMISHALKQQINRSDSLFTNS